MPIELDRLALCLAAIARTISRLHQSDRQCTDGNHRHTMNESDARMGTKIAKTLGPPPVVADQPSAITAVENASIQAMAGTVQFAVLTRGVGVPPQTLFSETGWSATAFLRTRPF
jgi:hypothetical protein